MPPILSCDVFRKFRVSAPAVFGWFRTPLGAPKPVYGFSIMPPAAAMPAAGNMGFALACYFWLALTQLLSACGRLMVDF